MTIFSRLWALMTVAFLGSALLESHAPRPLRTIYFSGLAQGTTYHITYYAPDTVVHKLQIDSILDKIDSSLSIYKPYSLITRFNNSTEGVQMDEHLSKVVRRSLEIFKETHGISDITVYPLVTAWGFGPSPISSSPDSASIEAILPCVGSAKLHIQGDRLVKDLPCVKLDVNGIAQGYSVDVVADFLQSRNIRNYLVEIGGEIRISGKKPDGTSMQVGIEAPAATSSSDPVIKKIIQPDDGGITTSGNYRKFYEKGGRMISHLIDPKTGYPFQNELISVTIWAKDAITADGYDNALMGMGLRKALQFMKRHTEMSAYLIYRKADHSISDTATAGFYKFFKHLAPEPARD